MPDTPAEFLVVRFKGNDYLLINDTLELTEGAIARTEEYVHFTDSYAYLNPNGDIVRYDEKIGTVADLEIVGRVPCPEPAPDAEENRILMTVDVIEKLATGKITKRSADA